MDKELKRQIRQDELITGAEHAWSWTRAHQERVKIWALVVVVAVVGLGIFRWLTATRQTDSQRALAEALATLEAPVRGEQPAGAPVPTGLSFATRQEQLTKAVGLFEGVRDRFGALPAGRHAALQAAMVRLELGELDVARKQLDVLIAGSDPLLAAEGRLGLAELEARRGNIDQAAEALQAIANNAQSPVPRDYALMRLGKLYEASKRPAEARKAYARIGDDFPDSPFAGEARQKVDYLPESRS